MSIKTLRKRIALVAVSALGAGLMSVVAVPSASAADNVAAGTTQTAAVVEGVLNIATKASTTGAAITTTTLVSSVPTLMESVGLVNVSDIAGGLTAGTTQTAVLLATGTLVVYTGFETNDKGARIDVDGGTISSCVVTGTAGNTSSVNSSSTACAAFDGTATADDTLAVAIKPNAGVSSMTVKLYNKASATSAAAHVVSSTPGDLNGQIAVTIATSSTAGVMAPTKSTAWWVATYNASAASADASGYTGSGDYNDELFLSIRVRDIYSNAITSSKLLSVSATGGARVKLNPSSATDVGTQVTDYAVTSSPDADTVIISNPGVNPIAGNITVSWDGTVIATRAYGFSGEATKLELSYLWNGKTGGTGNSTNATYNVVKYALFDAAGNAVYTDYSGTDNDATPPSNLLANSSLYGTIVTAVSTSATGARDSSLNLTTGVVTSGRVVYTCGSTAGKGKVGLTYTNPSGTVVTSNALEVTCAGTPVSYKASYDKATYRPGEVATLTIQFLDSKGNNANDVDTIATDSTGEITVSTAGMDSAINGPTADGSDEDLLTGGAVQYTFSVGQDEGTFTNRINVPDINTAGAAYGTAAVSATFTVSKGTAVGVTNAEVLAAIVKLIASINKQIRALQKSLRR